jgi:hypothetical protein
MRKLFLLTLSTGVLFLSSNADARNVWRECGIGGMLFKQTAWAAITSNVIWDLGTTATSSNVSSDELCEGPTASTASFINETYANLEEEIAVGEGQYLAAMVEMMGCDSGAAAQVVKGVRGDFSTRVSQSDYLNSSQSDNAEAFFHSTMAHAQSANCSAI